MDPAIEVRDAKIDHSALAHSQREMEKFLKWRHFFVGFGGFGYIEWLL
jgi:hypothetical protein